MPDDMGRLNDIFSETAFLYGQNAGYIEDLYARYVQNPQSVSADWQAFFQTVGTPEAQNVTVGEPSWARPRQSVRSEDLAVFDGLWPAVEEKLGNKLAQKGLSQEEVHAAAKDSLRTLMMIRAYRIRGHLAADLDPLDLMRRETHPELDPASYGFGPEDMEREIYIDNVLGLERAKLKDIIALLKRTYCGTLGVEYMHISDPAQKAWIQDRIEGPDKDISFTKEGKIAILRKLIEVETFERFVHKRYPGTKRFGLDGAESMVPALEQIIKRGGALGVKDIVIGMPHRGRLNVLAAVMGKPYRAIFNEFQGGSANPDDIGGSGDVKYHLGASSDREFDGNSVHLSLTANPSHLEAVDPVVLGKARGKYARAVANGADPIATRTETLPLLLHGDAAFAGQGVVAECFALTGLNGYRTSGCVHFIVNNQIGFTTSPHYSRSSPYPSDVAKTVQAPILHVNGDDPEAVVHAAKIATEFRQEFGWDVVIDMFCYRRYGHNEGDDPSFTQPLMYKKIKGLETTRTLYQKRLVSDGVVSEDDVDGWITEFESFLDVSFEQGKDFKPDKADWLDGAWTGFVSSEGRTHGSTGVGVKVLKDLGKRITTIPDDVDCHRTLKRVITARREAIDSGENIGWALAEHLAFASLLNEGHPVRLSGQDSARGTFSQRHSHIVDQSTEERYTPLNNLGGGQATYEVIDSALSEFAVLGFEYGYSLVDPNSLVMWEAQFGDFANGAQVIVDQFISAAEAKWLRMSGLVMLLPHGYEGQGPEHSSARLERYLQLCAEDNMQVANCTTPANYFHILRRQVARNFRKPLIIMTPKSLLRHKKCVSTLADMGPKESFQPVLPDDAELRPDVAGIKLKTDKSIKRVVMCSGKVYYDLLDARAEKGADDVYLVRVEELYPYPDEQLRPLLKRFPGAEFIWCQEEPKNMGAWHFINPLIEETLLAIKAKHSRPRYAGRAASASTATGYASRHQKQLDAFLSEALGR